MIDFVNNILKKTFGRNQISNYLLAKKYFQLKITLKAAVKDVLFICIGVLSATIGLKSFILPNHFIDGGAMGISLLISFVSPFTLPVLVIIVNLPFIFLASKQIGKSFAIKTVFAISLLALMLTFINTPNITHDKLLVAIFGGVFLGAGIGFSIRGGAVIDGTEVLAIYISRKLSTTIGDIIFIINILIFSVAAYLLTIEVAMYSILTYLSASKAIDFIVEGIEEYNGVTIISAKHEDIRLMIIEILGRGVTVYKGSGGYGKTGINTRELDILYTVITRLEISKLQTEIEKIDPHAFVVMHSVKDTKGGMIKKKPLKH